VRGRAPRPCPRSVDGASTGAARVVGADGRTRSAFAVVARGDPVAAMAAMGSAVPFVPAHLDANGTTRSPGASSVVVGDSLPTRGVAASFALF
jgi:hypothetical protein